MREATRSDWPQLWPLLQGMGTREDEAPARRTFEQLLEDDRWWIGVIGVQGSLVGYAAVQDHGPRLRATASGRIARLHDIYVLDSHRGRGFGRVLMAAAVEWAGARAAYLQWQAHEETAAPFYDRLGYERCPQPDYPEFEVEFPLPPVPDSAP